VTAPGPAVSRMLRIGHGSDVHRLVEGRPLLLGGVHVPHPRGLLGHSDGDVVLHAVCDAILGAMGAGDIGEHFPDSDRRYHGADSATLLRHVVTLMHNAGWRAVNVDVTICAETPRLAPHRDAMRRRLADLLGLEAVRLTIGRGEAIAASSVLLLEKGEG
jgi:2-C-methyl-D-erythritol 2,4-cyclodiphosphate synthase